MRIGLCQINTTVGDFDGNRWRIERAAREVYHEGAQLAVFPELAICGYPPEDLLLRPGFLAAHDQTLRALAESLPPDLSVLVGCLARNEAGGHVGRPLFNAVALIVDGLVRVAARKCLLPTYDVFDEHRYFEPCDSPEANVVTVAGVDVGITVCEDAWNDDQFFDERLYPIDPVARLVDAGCEVLVNLAASPWGRRKGEARGKDEFRLDMLRAAAHRHGRKIVFVNLVGGNVGTQFDGGSAGIGPHGLAAAPVYFAEHCQVIDTGAEWALDPPSPPLVEKQHAAAVQGIRDYAGKFGFERAVLGLSGGIDSALTAALAVDALGADHVTGLAMPSAFSSTHSLEDARALARNLGIALHEIPIEPVQEAYRAALAGVFAGTEPGVAEENLQARARGTLLMAFANKFGALLLTTGNKSECAVGYCTLYGDMCGALAPIADLWKTEVWTLARWINRAGERIPQRSIDKPPSAELRPDQLDTDSLPPYPDLDPVLSALIECEKPVGEVAELTDMPYDTVAAIFAKIQASEFKRFQYAPTVRLSERCWGGRRAPVSHRFTSEG